MDLVNFNGKQYNGVLVEDSWGKTYLCSTCTLTGYDLGEDCRIDAKHAVLFHWFLDDLVPRWNLRDIWHALHQHAKPWDDRINRYSPLELREAVQQIFLSGDINIWQLTDGWVVPPAGQSGDTTSAQSEDTSNQYTARPAARKTRQPSQQDTGVSATTTTAAQHESAPAPNQNTQQLNSNAAERKALYAKHGIKVGPYKELQKIKLPGYQREHFIPHSCFQASSRGSGESRADVPIGNAFGSYNEGDAITYFVFDDQSKGTEHRYLTDVEKKYAKSLHDEGKYASVNEWLDYMECETAKSLSMDTIERAPGVYEARVPEDEAKLVAKAIRIDTENYFDKAGVDKNAPLSNLVGGGDVPAVGDTVKEDF